MSPPNDRDHGATTMETSKGDPADADLPRGVWLMAGTEFWERFSYYGFMGIFILYMVDSPQAGGLGLDQSRALFLFGFVTSLMWICPILGGWLADRHLGHRRAVTLGALGLGIGNLVLALSSYASSIDAGNWAVALAVLGCAAMVAGAGLFKSNASALLSALFHEGDPRRERGFVYFYMGINLGALVAPLGAGTVGAFGGWWAGFALAGIGMLVGLAIFARFSPGLFPSRAVRDTVTAGSDTRGLFANRQAQLIMLMAAFATIYMIGQMTYGGMLNLYAAHNVDRSFGGVEIPGIWFLSLNPLMVILLGAHVARLWQRRALSTRRILFVEKIALGLALTAAAFLFMVVVETGMGDGLRPAWVLVIFYLLITLAELCVLPAGLVEISRRAPTRFVGVLMGVWLFTMGAGSFLAGWLGSLTSSLGLISVFAIIGSLGMVAGVILFLSEPALRRWLGPLALST
jgi:POT family proton-dependent oligopeptide transporter